MSPSNPPPIRDRRHPMLGWVTPAILAASLPIASLVLVLLGYGYALAVESRFGVPASLVADGALDHMHLSVPVVAHILEGSLGILGSLAYHTRLLQQAALPLLVATAFWALWVWAWSRPRAWRRLIARCRRRLRRRPARRLQDRRAAGARLAWPLLWLVGAWSLVPALVWLLALAVGIAASLVSIVPLWGYQAGMRSLQTWVIEPETCRATRTRTERLQAAPPTATPGTARTKVASCVRVTQPGGTDAAQGRLVVATTRSVVLFDPVTGEVRRVPADGATLTPLPSLDAPVQGPDRAGPVR